MCVLFNVLTTITSILFLIENIKYIQTSKYYCANVQSNLSWKAEESNYVTTELDKNMNNSDCISTILIVSMEILLRMIKCRIYTVEFLKNSKFTRYVKLEVARIRQT